MARKCACPQNAAVSDVTILECLEQFDQLAKLALQRLRSGDGSVNKFTVAEIVTLAAWTAKLGADDGTKMQITPVIQEPDNEPGAARTYGGGNLTLGGLEIVLGSEKSTFTGKFLRQPQLTMSQLKDFQCESLGTFLIDKSGNIGCLVDDLEAPTECYPIPTYSFRVGDKGFGNLEGVDYNSISWAYLEDWSDRFKIFSGDDFNAFTDLVNG